MRLIQEMLKRNISHLANQILIINSDVNGEEFPEDNGFISLFIMKRAADVGRDREVESWWKMIREGRNKGTDMVTGTACRRRGGDRRSAEGDWGKQAYEWKLLEHS